MTAFLALPDVRLSPAWLSTSLVGTSKRFHSAECVFVKLEVPVRRLNKLGVNIIFGTHWRRWNDSIEIL
jgi:hypothetical protein